MAALEASWALNHLNPGSIIPELQNQITEPSYVSNRVTHS